MTTQNLTDNYQLNTEWPNLFKLLNKNELEILDANKIEVNYQAGEIIRKQSAPLTHIIVYVTGMAKLYIEAIGKKNIILRLIKPGNLVGGPGFYFDLRHHYTIKALLDSSTYFIHIDLFRDLLNKNKNFGYEFNWISISKISFNRRNFAENLILWSSISIFGKSLLLQ